MSIEVWWNDRKGNKAGEMKEDKACYTNRLLKEEGKGRK